MLKVGLTGGIGTGKSLVSAIMGDCGAHLIDADLLGHESYNIGTSGLHQVVKVFGDHILGADGSIDRDILGRIVFNDRSQMQNLNNILHPIIYETVKDRIGQVEEDGNTMVVVEAAVLIEAQWQSLFDQVWVVKSDEETVIRRLLRRNGFDRNEACKRIESQISESDRLSHADVIIDNNGTREELEVKVKDLWEKQTNGIIRS